MPIRDPDLPLVVGRAEAAAAGLSDGQIYRRARSGAWTKLRRGRFAPARDLEEHRRWQAEIMAHLAEHRRALVLSHAHAARAWGLPAPLGGWGRPAFTAATGAVRFGHVKIVVAPLGPADRVSMGAADVTSLARTVVDCARTLPGRDALAIADAALASRRVSRDDLARAVAQVKGWPGAPRARHVAALADGRRESPLESWSAWSFDEQGLPRPLRQVEILDVTGILLGRGDTWWPQGVVGEADGRAKYRLRALERGGASAENFEAVLHEQRVREMRLHRTGALVVRWEPRDVLVAVRAAELAGHVRQQLVSASYQQFEGTIRVP